MSRKGLIERWEKAKKYKVREYSRCLKCGRARGYMQAFKLCRVCFRELAHEGFLPGVRKASW